MKKDKTLQIIETCLKIDLIAHQAYYLLSTRTQDPAMKKFWFEMAEEENMHIRFWQHFQKLSENGALPDVFENPDEVIVELESIIPKAKVLLERCKTEKDTISSITLAYRLEFYLLHPAFEVLFHFLGSANGFPSPEDSYDNHINKFITMLSVNAETSPELELLGETLQKLWQENKKLAHQVSTDSLTKVLNRRGFFTLSLQMTHLAQRQNTSIGLMMLDIDDFKKINDTYGHQTGDLVLKKVARIITSTSRASDIIGRYGGEEFCVFMPDTDVDAILPVAERMRKAIVESRPHDLTVSVSIGAASAKIKTNAPEEFHKLLQKADENMYHAKKAGKNRVFI